LEAVGFDAASTASASALPLPIAVILLVAIPPTKLEAPYRFQNPAFKKLSNLLFTLDKETSLSRLRHHEISAE